MSAERFAVPPPGHLTAVVPAVGAQAAVDLEPVRAAIARGGRPFAVAQATAAPTGQLAAGTRLAAVRPLPRAASGEAWLHPLPELRGRLERPWQELTHAERYLVQIACARLEAVDLLVLELPSSRLAGPRVLRLVEDLARDGMGILWLERRLRLIASFDIDAWLADGDVVEGPLRSSELLQDRRALRLCFGGGLDDSAAPSTEPPERTHA